MTFSGSKQIVVCMPTRSEPSAETRQALRDNLDGFEGTLLITVGKRVDQARNELALSASAYTVAEMVLWVDDDAWWPAGTVARLAADLERFPDSIVMGSFCRRREYDQPVATRWDSKAWLIQTWLLRAIKAGLEKRELTPDELGPAFELRDAGELVKVQTIGGHFFAHRPDVLLRPAMAYPFTALDWMRDAWIEAWGGHAIPLLTEDTIFSLRARTAGLSLFVDLGAPVAHLDRRSGFAYLPAQPAMRIRDNALIPAEGPVPAAAPRSWREFRVTRSEDKGSQQLLEFIRGLFGSQDRRRLKRARVAWRVAGPAPQAKA